MGNKRVVAVTGGCGFFGGHIVEALQKDGRFEAHAIDRRQYDLCEGDKAHKMVDDIKPDIIIHAAAKSGGIVWNQQHPGSIYADNVLMTNNVLTAATSNSCVKKVVSIISSCAYPDSGEDLVEENFWHGLPHESIMFFGLQKRNVMAMSMALAKDFSNMQFICPVINNMYGPRDSQDLHKTKVVGALIRKFQEAKRKGDGVVVCLGTGAPTRQFTYVEDAATAVVRLIDGYDNSFMPLNISTPEETSIKELSELVAEITQYEGNIVWDHKKPDGQLRKSMNIQRFNSLFGEQKWTSLREGLTKTINA